MTQTATPYPPPDPETLQALYEYRARVGADWKTKLLLAWMRASEPGLLQRLRNERGPRWLASYELPEGGTSAPRRQLSRQESSKLLKATLREAFPGTRFSVKLSRGTSYGNVEVFWTGPSIENVEEVTSVFQGRGFDGTDDSTTFLDTALMLDSGEVVKSGLGMVMLYRERDGQEVL